MMSILPQASIAVWTSLSGAPSAVRSPPKTVVSPLISDAACSARSASRLLMTTLAPCSDSSSAVARPMPRAEPVTTATLSSRTPMAQEDIGGPRIQGGLTPSATAVANGVRPPRGLTRRPLRSPCSPWSAAGVGSAQSERSRTGVLQPVRTSDDVEHDLVRAGADPVQPQVAPRPLDLVLAHVAGPAVDLQALVRDLAAHLRRVQLGHRDLAHRVLAVGEAPGGGVDELARGVDLGGQGGELVADPLEVPDLAAERPPLERVGQRAVERPLGAGDAARRADQPLALELPHDVVEALADPAEHRAAGHADVVEGQ